jgi:hypothetical protein
LTAHPQEAGAGLGDYLGVWFNAHDDGRDRELGKPMRGVAECWTQADYSELVAGARFFVKEGSRSVGEGTVLETWEVGYP